jgi:Integrase zinc binding domain
MAGKIRSLICYNNKIVVPKHLHQHVFDWYHITLCHPEINKTEETISQHLFWGETAKNKREHISEV